MKKAFASGESAGPNVANLQLRFWDLAIDQFEAVAEKWKEFAVDEEAGGSAPTGYDEDDFVIDAGVAIVLAGTSVSELLGQNVPPANNGTPSPTPAYKQYFNVEELPAETASFLKIYDDIRHFGPAKHKAVECLTPEDLCNHMTAAQEIWRTYLAKVNRPIQPQFDHVFAFPE